jgi:hypothetical protein
MMILITFLGVFGAFLAAVAWTHNRLWLLPVGVGVMALALFLTYRADSRTQALRRARYIRPGEIYELTAGRNPFQSERPRVVVTAVQNGWVQYHDEDRPTHRSMSHPAGLFALIYRRVGDMAGEDDGRARH